MKVLCVFGEHQYGDPERGEGIEFASFIPALRRLGHEVLHFESWNKKRYVDLAEMNSRLLDTVETFRPDVLFSAQIEYEIWIETVEVIRARGDVATVFWAADDSWKYREVSRFYGAAYHAMTTTYDYVIPRYHADGIEQVMLTQWAVSSQQLAEPLPAKECRYPVSFVGAAHGDRRARIEALRSSGIEVACFGHGWESGSVDFDQLNRIMRDSVISLNFANSRGPKQIKARNFEVPGAGGFLLTEAVQGIEHFYVPGEEVVTFDSDDDLVSKIRHFLSHPEQRDRIALAGYRRTAAEHTYEQRLQSILDFTIAAKAASSRSTPPDFQQALTAHRLTPLLRLMRNSLLFVGCFIFGPVRGKRFARRLVFELSWRLVGRHTFTAAGWPGRMFPHT